MMFNLLIVDDEYYAIEAVKTGVRWDTLGFSNVYEAYNTKQAKQRLQEEVIDVVICDIEMPDGNGIELLEWINCNYPATETLFLTCHADFHYAKRAVQLGSHDYLLKPVDYQDLEKSVRNILGEIQQEREMKRVLDKHQSFWESKKTVLLERFWQDILGARLSTSSEHLRESVQEYSVPFEADTMAILPILISIEHWAQVFSDRDEEILEYAVRNAAKEIILDGIYGDVIQDRNGVNLILIYCDKTTKLDIEILAERCEALNQANRKFFYCKTSCYVGESGSIERLKTMYDSILRMEYDNVTQSQSVHRYQMRETSPRAFQAIDLSEWYDLIEKGDVEGLNNLIDHTINQMKQQGVNAEELHHFYHSILQALYSVLYKKGKNVHDVFGSAKHFEPRTVQQLKDWMVHAIETVIACLKENKDSFVYQVKQYIQEHLDEKFDRIEIAEHVHLNPAYLSRLFRRETGETLSDYILALKMNLAKELLRNSNKPISEISNEAGYSNFSHFTKTFKKMFAVNPQAYRKQK
jgi:two-component system response regulator YesN